MKSNNPFQGHRLDYMALTISPPPNNDVVKAYNKWKIRLSKLKCNFILYPEIAYNSKENKLRLHFHGRINCINKTYFQADIEYLKGFCFIDVKPIVNDYKWYLYCIKELQVTKVSLNLKKKDIVYLTNSSCEQTIKLKTLDDYFLT